MEYTYQEYDCGCEIATDNMGTYEIGYCPKHKAADALYEALKDAVADIEKTGYTSISSATRMQKALAEADGK